jgi:predicted HTH transcriptional regulator
MKIFKDLKLVDYLGSGIPKIIQKYGRNIFHISENVIRTYLPFDRSLDETEGKRIMEYEESKEEILSLIRKNPSITMAELAKTLNLSKSGIEKNIRQLRNNKKITRIGATKNGYWKILPSK